MTEIKTNKLEKEVLRLFDIVKKNEDFLRSLVGDLDDYIGQHAEMSEDCEVCSLIYNNYKLIKKQILEVLNEGSAPSDSEALDHEL